MGRNASGNPSASTWRTPRWLGLRLLYAIALLLALVGAHLPSALAPHAAYPLPLWHLALFIVAFFVCLLVHIPVSGTIYLNAAVTALVAVLLIAGVPATLVLILAGHIALSAYQAARHYRRRKRVNVVALLYDLGNNLSIKAIATVAAGVALLPFRVVPWDGSRPWPDVLQIVFPLLVLVVAYTLLDALCDCLWQNISSPAAIRLRMLELVEAVGLWKVCLAFLGLAGAVLYTTNLFWMLSLMAFVAFLQTMYGQRAALLQATLKASDSLRQAVVSTPDVSPGAAEDPDHQKMLVHYSALAAKQLIDDRALLAYKDEVVSLLAHDLRNPLATISGFATLLQRRARERPDGAKDVADLSRVLAQIKHMATLLDLLVVSSRGSADLFGVSMRVLDLAEMVNETVAQVRTGAPDYLWRLEIEERVPVNCDPDRITQVLTNLLQNAVKYSPTGSVITVSLRTREGEAILSIQDHGIGVPARDQERIFQRLQRGSNVAGTAPGLGAGLYIVSRIVQAHEGRTWVESEEGQGSTFYVALPLCRNIAPAVKASAV